MNDLQKEVVVGSLLGDGWLQGRDRYNWTFCKKQKSTRKEYLDWHFSVLGDLSCSLALKEEKLKFECYKSHDKISSCYLFSTHANKEFTDMAQRWYKKENGKFVCNEWGQKIKVVPDDLVLSPVSMAVWFCDDGTNSVEHRTAVIYTDGFTKKECNFLSDKIFDTFSISTTVHTSRGKPVIRISAKDYVNFIEIIKPHVVWPCFKYKVESRAPKFGEQHHKAKFSDADVENIKKLCENGIKQSHVAKQFGVSKTCICNILKGKRRS